MRQLFVAVVLLCALAFPASVQAAPYFDFGVHDDGAVVFNRDHQRQPVLRRARDIGATWLRTIIYRDRVQGGNFRVYRRSIRDVYRHHFHVQAVIECSGQAWTPDSFAAYVKRVVRQLQPLVRRWSICNEPNQPGWLTAIPGYDLPTTYRWLYLAGYSAVKQVQPQAAVLFGELSSNYYPLEFMRKVFCDQGDLDGNCTQLKTSCVAYHPYQQESPLSPSNVPFTVGIGSLNLLVDDLDQLHAKNLLTTANGVDRPPLCLTEFGYQSRARGILRVRNVPDEVRKQRWREAFNLVCKSPIIKQIFLYQMQSEARGRWDTSIMSRSGQPDKTYFGIRSWRYAHPECMR
ncbi:hypothetical protein EPO04_03660 [Patescibacteria group bacterium]|nr:MAG: hypothetical protein EPO04_03660 [Patescibacteria group bacterium]